MTTHLTVQEFLEVQAGQARVEYKGRWLSWLTDLSSTSGGLTPYRWTVKEWRTDLNGTRRIKVLVRTDDEAEAVYVLMYGKTENEGQDEL